MADRNTLMQKIGLLQAKAQKLVADTGTVYTKIPGLRIARRNEPDHMEHCFYKPVFSVTLQGQKRIAFGDEDYLLEAGKCTMVVLDIPSTSYVVEATTEKPYLAMTIELDKHIVRQLMTEIPSVVETAQTSLSAVVADVEEVVVEAYLRFAELLDNPAQIPVLAPLIMKEIHFRLLTGPHGRHLQTVNSVGTQTNQVAQAITWLKGNFNAPLKVEALARQVNMGVSTFHRHFKQLTTLSPLQYQKNLRLHEAQRLMLAESYDATNAGYAVGYENVAQFNREYKRLFGEPPLRDIKRLQH